MRIIGNHLYSFKNSRTNLSAVRRLPCFNSICTVLISCIAAPSFSAVSGLESTKISVEAVVGVIGNVGVLPKGLFQVQSSVQHTTQQPTPCRHQAMLGAFVAVLLDKTLAKAARMSASVGIT